MTTIEHVDITDLVPAWQRDLVYVDYRDELSPEQVERILRDGYDEHVDEWVSEAQWRAACELAAELKETNPGLLADIDDLMEEILDIDTSDSYRDLLRNTGRMLFRYSPPEDDMVWIGGNDWTAGRIAYELGLPLEFLPTVTEIWPEIEGYTISGGAFGASIVFSADPSDLLGKQRVVVHDPFLWLCNPWAGNGYGEVAEGCTVALDVEHIHVDKFAWGYSANDVFGLYLPDSKVEEA